MRDVLCAREHAHTRVCWAWAIHAYVRCLYARVSHTRIPSTTHPRAPTKTQPRTNPMKKVDGNTANILDNRSRCTGMGWIPSKDMPLRMHMPNQSFALAAASRAARIAGSSRKCILRPAEVFVAGGKVDRGCHASMHARRWLRGVRWRLLLLLAANRSSMQQRRGCVRARMPATLSWTRPRRCSGPNVTCTWPTGCTWPTRYFFNWTE